MSELNYLLTKLAEECGEVQDAIHNSLPLSDLTMELRDVIATIDLINQNGGLGVQLPCSFDWFSKASTKTDTIFNCANKMQYYVFKGLLFGFDDIRPGYNKNNAEELQNIAGRYIQTIQVFSKSFSSKNPPFSILEVFDVDGILAKQEKIKTWMQHSFNKELLTLDGVAVK